MPIDPRDIPQTHARDLAELLAGERAMPVWQADELGDILRHQLAAPLEFEFAENGTPVQAGPDRSRINSFAALLAHPRPPLDLLMLTKAFAKRYMTDPAGALPREVASVLYFASILAARLRLGERISSLDDAALGEGAAWCLRQPWLDESLAPLFREQFSSII